MDRMGASFRVGVVGAGYFGRFHVDGWRRIPDATLVGVYDIDGERAATALREAGANEGLVFSSASQLLDIAPDILDITTPPETHLALIREAAGRVPYIICQKPFCGGLEGARQAIAICEAAGTQIAVHENVRFQPWYRVMRQLIDAGAVGTPYQISFRFRPGDGQNANAYLDRQPYFRTMERFLVHETAIHWIDTFRYLFGEIKAVTAQLTRRNPVIAGEDGGTILFRFASGATGVFDGNRLADHAAADPRLTLGEMLVEGSTGSLQLSGAGHVARRAFGTSEWTGVDFTWQDRHFGGDCVMLCNYASVDAWRRGDTPETAASLYLRNMEIAEAIYVASNTGRSVDV
ncbi:MAG: Gfo/Idh/MocA family oxidoreductase [Pseudomonadota bacterium]